VVVLRATLRQAYTRPTAAARFLVWRDEAFRRQTEMV